MSQENNSSWSENAAVYLAMVAIRGISPIWIEGAEDSDVNSFIREFLKRCSHDKILEMLQVRKSQKETLFLSYLPKYERKYTLTGNERY